MNDTAPPPSPPHRTRRVSLTKAQLRTELGAELLSLCESVTADGKLAPEEIQGLREWLRDDVAAELPGASYLREVIERVLADGQITREECREVYRALEVVLPPEVRRQATAARKAAEREDRCRDKQLAAANFMVAGVRHEGRGDVIRQYVNVGDPVLLVRDRGNQYSRFAIGVMLENGMQIGFVPEEDAQCLAPLLDDGAKFAAWITKILGRGRVPIPVVQTKLYPTNSAIDVEQMSRAFRNKMEPREWAMQAREEGSSMSGWIWIAAGFFLLVVIFAFQ